MKNSSSSSNHKNYWNEFLKKGDINSYLEYRKKQKRDTEISSDGLSYGAKRRDSNKKY